MAIRQLGIWVQAPDLSELGERGGSINSLLTGIQSVVDKNASVVPEYTQSESTEVLSTEDNAFSDAIYAKDGCIYCIPRNIAELCVLDPETLTVVDRINTGGRLNGTYDPERNVIYLTRDYSIFEFDVATRSFNSTPIGSFIQKTTVVVSREGKLYALPKGDNYSVQIYDVETGECRMLPRENKVGWVWSHAAWGHDETIWAIWRFPNYKYHAVYYDTKSEKYVDCGEVPSGTGGPVSTPSGIIYTTLSGSRRIENGELVPFNVPMQYSGYSHSTLVADGSIAIACGTDFSANGYIINEDESRCATFSNSHGGICVTTPHYIVVVPHNNNVSNYRLTRVVLNNFTKFSHEQCYSKIFNP